MIQPRVVLARKCHRVIPGLTASGEGKLRALLAPRITSLAAETLATMEFHILGIEDAALAAIGVHATGTDLMVVVTDPTRPIGRLEVQTAAPGCVLFLDNRAAEGNLHGLIRMLGRDAAVLFPALGAGYIGLEVALLRSDSQLLFWGQGATAVGCSLELEGSHRIAAIGDDALISSDVWIRNHDMHALVDMRSGKTINRPPMDIIVERHVWIGQNALVLNCRRIGAGSIIGAQSLVKTEIGEFLAVGGVPARMLRTEVSWGRDAAGISQPEMDSLGSLPLHHDDMTS